MFNKMQINSMLQELEHYMRNEALTPARHIDVDTFICFTERLPNGMAYHQAAFNDLPAFLQESFRNRAKGERIGQYKIVAAFDIWQNISTPLASKRWTS